MVEGRGDDVAAGGGDEDEEGSLSCSECLRRKKWVQDDAEWRFFKDVFAGPSSMSAATALFGRWFSLADATSSAGASSVTSVYLSSAASEVACGAGAAEGTMIGSVGAKSHVFSRRFEKRASRSPRRRSASSGL